mgnify:CR=1 FL=1
MLVWRTAYLPKPAEALPYYEQALAMKLDTADLHSNRGIVLRELHRHQDALASIFRAVFAYAATSSSYRALTLRILKKSARKNAGGFL